MSAPPASEPAGDDERGEARASVAPPPMRWWPFALIVFCFVSTWPYHAGLNNPNEITRVYMTRSLVEQGKWSIDEVIRSWGPVDDKAVRDGKLYSSKAPLQSLVGVPGYFLLSKLDAPAARDKRRATTAMRFFGSIPIGLALAFALLLWIRRRGAELSLPETSATAAGLCLALGTMIYPYSITYTGHGLAAATSGGCFLAILHLLRTEVGSTRWRAFAVVAGFLGGATPFAEYPAALIALPALIAAFASTEGMRARASLFGWLAVGGALPFSLGLWSHHELWGSVFKTGYSFLENTSYVQLHGTGFFGVNLPKPERFFGALFSPGTGLFFFSPVLVVGLVFLVRAAFTPQRWVGAARPIPRSLAIAALIGVGLEMLFISGHNGWRGGWTVGPRYIIGVVPVLGVFLVEGLSTRSGRIAFAGLGAASIAFTGFASALYPHLSDVFTNPLATFLWPSYRDAYSTFGLGQLIGLRDGFANIVHIVPLTAALSYVLFASTGGRPTVVIRLIPIGLFLLLGAIVLVIPERDPKAAHAENERLWGFWEPAPARPDLEGLVFRATQRWRSIHVEVVEPDGVRRRCLFQGGNNEQCRYGSEEWQHFGPEPIEVGGRWVPLLFLHPITGRTLHVSLPVVRNGHRAVLRYGLSDASVESGNDSPIELRVRQRGAWDRSLRAENVRGLETVELTVSSTIPIELEMTVQNDGARVFGFDLDVFED